MRALTDAERVARAYAILDLTPGVSPKAALRQYRRLAKRWHPDRYASDPQGQMEASQRMRQINAAFATIRPLLRQDAQGTPPRPRPWSRLSPEDIDAIVETLRSPSMFDYAFEYGVRGALLVSGLTLLGIGARYQKPVDLVFGGLLVVACFIVIWFAAARSGR